jgi:predicted TIM-barrel fold metal-dependent hydrolase
VCALLESFPNVLLSMGSNYTVHGGIEDIVKRFGAGRLLFGTGSPKAEPAMAVLQLVYADIPDADRQAIGSENLDRLIGGIHR